MAAAAGTRKRTTAAHAEPCQSSGGTSKRSRPRPLLLGSDCSGLGGASLALELLGVPHVEVFASEICRPARELLQRNYSPRVLYTDVTKRNHADVPDMDLYMAGFPCISWSSAGRRQGLASAHGIVGLHCLRTIECKRPRAFLLENVPHMTSGRHVVEFELTLNFLKSIQDSACMPAVMPCHESVIGTCRESVAVRPIRIRTQGPLPITSSSRSCMARITAHVKPGNACSLLAGYAGTSSMPSSGPEPRPTGGALPN